MAGNVLVQESHSYNLPPERVFDAWLTPALAGRFLFASRTGNIMHCEIDPRVGGGFTVTDRRPNPDGEESFFEAQHRGVYVEIDRPRRIVFDFCVEPYASANSRVTLDFAKTAAGCDLLLTHDLGDDDDAHSYADRTRRGWSAMLRQLEKVLTTRIWGFKVPGSV